jgi:hypothetical protein
VRSGTPGPTHWPACVQDAPTWEEENSATAFAAAMAEAGVARAAVEFARRFEGIAYLDALDSDVAGPVALAHVFFPYSANENSAWFLVNRTPELIDVDDRRYLAVDAVERIREYRALLRRHSELMLWPGMRAPWGPGRFRVATAARASLSSTGSAISVMPAPSSCTSGLLSTLTDPENSSARVWYR